MSKSIVIDMPPQAALGPGDRFDKLDGMDFPGVVRARFVDKTGRVCYVVKIDGRFGFAIVGPSNV